MVIVCAFWYHDIANKDGNIATKYIYFFIMKECLKCGTTMSDNSGDYCEKCKKKDNFIGEEKIINFFSNLNSATLL